MLRREAAETVRHLSPGLLDSLATILSHNSALLEPPRCTAVETTVHCF